MKIEEHPAFKNDKQNLIDYLDKLVFLVQEYANLSGYNNIKLIDDNFTKIHISSGFDVLANAINADIEVEQLDSPTFECKKTFKYKGVDFFQYYFRGENEI